MSLITNFLSSAERYRNEADEVVIATVVKVEGSSYRRAGARMLIAPHCQVIGIISGGCLEKELCKRALWLTRNHPVVRKYSTEATGEDAEFAFGLGCDGVIHVLLERLNDGGAQNTLNLLKSVRQHQKPGIHAVVVSSQVAGWQVGDRMSWQPCGGITEFNREHLLSLKNNRLYEQIQQDLIQQFNLEKSLQKIYQLPDGQIEVFFEYIPVPKNLMVIGAGQDAVPLVKMAQLAGWECTVVDARPHYIRSEQFKGAKVVLVEPNQASAQKFLDEYCEEHTAVCIMSHSLEQDRFWLDLFLKRKPCYLGQLGPKHRTDRMLKEIAEQNGYEPDTNRLFYPIGLDLGGDTPESVALSILAEVTAHCNNRSAGSLRLRRQPIHLPDDTEIVNLN